MRGLPLLGIVCAALGCTDRGRPDAPNAGNELPVEEQIKALLPEAASNPVADFEAIATGRPRDVDVSKFSQSLTWVLLTTPGPPTPAAGANPADWFTLDGADDGRVSKAVLRSKDRGYGTLLQPEFITGVTCAVAGPSAEGVVTFRAEGVYRGRAEYTARERDGRWQVEELRMPGLGVRVRRGEGGRWVRVPP